MNAGEIYVRTLQVLFPGGMSSLDMGGSYGLLAQVRTHALQLADEREVSVELEDDGWLTADGVDEDEGELTAAGVDEDDDGTGAAAETDDDVELLILDVLADRTIEDGLPVGKLYGRIAARWGDDERPDLFHVTAAARVLEADGYVRSAVGSISDQDEGVTLARHFSLTEAGKRRLVESGILDEGDV